MTRVRVATIDSGVNPTHPHVEPIAGGIQVNENGFSENFIDVLGHGTAVAGAIREKAPDAEIFAVKVFDKSLVTSGTILLRALDWCLDERMQIINLSLGTLNRSYLQGFQDRVHRATEMGITIVGAYDIQEAPALPGSLPGVIAVVLDNSCPRTEYRTRHKNGQLVYAASGFPRDIPGVPQHRNLQGISFAVANVSGFLAAERCAS